MSISFQLIALDQTPFRRLFDLNDTELAAIDARRMIVDEKPGFPCRGSLADAEIGETVILFPFEHLGVASPYRATGPIFVRKGVEKAEVKPNEIPTMFLHRQLSIRGYDSADMMISAEVIHGSELETAITRMFSDNNVRYLHIHNARPGCYNCSVVRIQS